MRILEESLFGVCQRIGSILHISSAHVRLYFIYASFFTLGASFFVYLILGFWMNIRKLQRRNNNALWS